MNARSVKILAAIVIVLFGVLLALNTGERSGTPSGSDLLFPELKSRLNDLNALTVTNADGTVTLGRSGDESARWVSSDHGGYPADPAILRELLLALAEARKVEQKTSDPALYDRLGVEHPGQNGGDAVLVEARGDNAAVSIILGDVAQGDYRYARIPEEAQSWLIDRNPPVPDSKGGWLLPDIVDIETSRIRSATIRHADGEIVSIRKQDADAINFEMENIAEGRDLRYPSIANSIAAVPGGLRLEDVQEAADAAVGEAAAMVEFHTFDGLRLEVAVHTPSAPDDETDSAEGGDYWITLAASAASEAEPAARAPPPATEDAAETAESAVAAGDGAADGASDGELSPQEEAADINARTGGWAYRISRYKGEQLTRRQDDLLSDQNDDATE